MLPKWARTKGTLSATSSDQLELPTWAREAGNDPTLSVWEDAEGLPEWAKRGLTGNGVEKDNDNVNPSSDSDTLKLSSDGDILKLSSDDIPMQSPDDILKQSCDAIKDPTPRNIKHPLTGVIPRHPSDATVGALLYPVGDATDERSLGYSRDNVGTCEQASDVITSSTNDEPEVAPPATIPRPGTEVDKLASTSEQTVRPVPSDHMTSDITHDIDAKTKVTGDTDYSEVIHHYPHVSDESVPPVPKPSFFGHVSELAGADYTIAVPKTRFHETMHAMKESDWTDFTVRCIRRRHVIGQDITAETQEVTSYRPHIKMNRRVGASTESEHVDASIIKIKRFRELNIHHRHSSDSTVQTLLYGKKFGSIQDAQSIVEGMFVLFVCFLVQVFPHFLFHQLIHHIVPMCLIMKEKFSVLLYLKTPVNKLGQPLSRDLPWDFLASLNRYPT